MIIIVGAGLAGLASALEPACPGAAIGSNLTVSISCLSTYP